MDSQAFRIDAQVDSRVVGLVSDLNGLASDLNGLAIG